MHAMRVKAFMYSILFKGEHLTPLDYCSEENADLAELLRSFGGLSGEAATEQRAAAEKERAALVEAESMMIQEQEKDKDDGVLNYLCSMHMPVESTCRCNRRGISKITGKLVSHLWYS